MDPKDFSGERFETLRATCAEHDGVPLRGKVAGGGFANATARASDEDDFGFKVCLHAVCSFSIGWLSSMGSLVSML